MMHLRCGIVLNASTSVLQLVSGHLHFLRVAAFATNWSAQCAHISNTAQSAQVQFLVKLHLIAHLLCLTSHARMGAFLCPLECMCLTCAMQACESLRSWRQLQCCLAFVCCQKCHLIIFRLLALSNVEMSNSYCLPAA